MNRPGGNATGVTSLFGELAAKQVGLLRELVPAATLIGFLVNPSNPITERNVRDALDAAEKLGEKVEIISARNEAEIDAAFDALRGVRARALLVQLDAFLINKRIVELVWTREPWFQRTADHFCSQNADWSSPTPITHYEISMPANSPT